MSEAQKGVDAPFSRPISVEAAREAGQRLEFVASAAECAALAEQDGLLGLRDLKVEAAALPHGREGLLVKGRVTAVVKQACVVTLEPFESPLDETFEVEFAPEAEARAWAAEAEDHAGSEDPPDPIVGGKVDIGALAVEFLALGLDPYPRKPGVRFKEIESPGAENGENAPFAALAALKKD